MRAFFRIAAGQPTGLRAAAGRAGWARTGHGGYPGIQPGLPLRAAPPTASAWPQRCSARIYLITCSNIGSVAFLAGRGTCQSATFWGGCASVCWRGR